MSILIKGMELPEDKEIFLRIDEKGEVYVYGSYPTELHKAVPVPPHGDLIDRDALLSRGKNNPFVDSEIYHPCVQTNCREIVMDEPVVVPADKEETDD